MVLEMPFLACLDTVIMPVNINDICNLLFLLQDPNPSILTTYMMFLVSCMQSEQSGTPWECY